MMELENYLIELKTKPFQSEERVGNAGPRVLLPLLLDEGEDKVNSSFSLNSPDPSNSRTVPPLNQDIYLR